ncbi:MAG: hypothetical protein KKA90_00950 [Nanoarchaeota archaeon]|nr:hypothetical protein [Nanoarchaeota archaeon]
MDGGERPGLKCFHCGTITSKFAFCLKCQSLCCPKCYSEEHTMCRSCRPKAITVELDEGNETVITS